MNTYSNFGSYNGWMLPGSCWGACGSCGDDFYYVDQNGDVWVPCCCSTGTSPTSPTSPSPIISATAAAPCGVTGASETIPLQYVPNRSGATVQVNYPEGLLYYPNQSFFLDGKAYQRGMLADADKGGRYTYKGVHTGRVRLHMAHTNKTDSKALFDETGAAQYIGGVFEGLDLHYAIGFLGGDGASATVMRQGATVGTRGGSAVFADYLFSPQATRTYPLGEGQPQWLFLAREQELTTNPSQLPCKFLDNERLQVGFGTEPDRNSMEALLDLELKGDVTVICCAYHDFSKVDLNGTMFPMPASAVSCDNGDIFPATGLTGIRRHFWNWESVYSWPLDDSAAAQSLCLRAQEEPEPLEVLLSGDAAPNTSRDLDQILFYPPVAPPVPVQRIAEGMQNPANRGTLYRQTIILRNNGELPRQVSYSVQCPAGSLTLALPQAGHQVQQFKASLAPQQAALVPELPPQGKRMIESWYIPAGAEEVYQVLNATIL